MNTHMASIAAMIIWMSLDYLREKKVSVVGACVGAIVGMVAITPAAGYVSVVSSLWIGAIAAAVCFFYTRLRARVGIDDTLDVFSCHGMGGIVGMLLTAVFAESGGLFSGGGASLLKTHLLALLIVGTYSFGASCLIYRTLRFFVLLEVTLEEEQAGLDLTQHGEVAEFWDGTNRRGERAE